MYSVFGLRSSYMLEYRWLFSLFLRSAGISLALMVSGLCSHLSRCHIPPTQLVFYCFSSTVVSIFTPPHTPASPILASHPQTYPCWLCPCVLYTCSLMALPLLSPIILSRPSYVSLFFISMFLVVFCLLFCCCWIGSTYRWDHMVFLFHLLAYFT